MSFAALFIALLIERFFDCSHLRNWSWYANYQRTVTQKLSGQSPYVILGVTAAPLILAVVLFELMIGGVAYGFLKLAFSVLILLYCFGPRNLWADTFACLNAFSEGDAPVAAEKIKVAFGITDVNDSQSMHRQWINAILVQANRRAFAIVIWFGLLGLLGVVLYRVMSLSIPEAGKEDTNTPVSNTARLIESYLDWVSIRVMTLLFALGGNFNHVMTCWRAKLTQGPESNDALLLECGMAALSSTSKETIPVDGSAEKEEINLLDRSIVIVLVVVAVLVFLIP